MRGKTPDFRIRFLLAGLQESLQIAFALRTSRVQAKIDLAISAEVFIAMLTVEENGQVLRPIDRSLGLFKLSKSLCLGDPALSTLGI